MKLFPASALFAVIFFLLSPPAFAETPDNLVRITADSILQESLASSLKVTGDVKIKWQGYTLFAEVVDYADQTRLVTASGGVMLLRADDVLTSDTLSIGLDTKKGVATNGNLLIGLDRKKVESSNSKPGTTGANLRMKGALIEKVDDNRYRIEKGSFTTCDADPPSWKFSADDLDITLDGYATGRDAVFSLAGIPVFYTPYILFPVLKERQSGFLFPTVGNSNKKGFSVDIPYYWAISPSAEATFDLDLQSKKGAGFGMDAAWLRRSKSHGKLKTYTIYDTELSRARAEISTEIKEVLTPDIDFNADVTLATDRSLYRDYSIEAGDYNRQILDSSISLTKKWHAWYLAGETRFLNDLDGNQNDRTLQRIPDLTVTGINQKLGNLPLYAGFGGRFTNFTRREGVTGGRFILQPTITYNTALPEGLSLSGWGGYQQRFYSASGGAGEGEKGVGLAMAGASASAAFAREFALSSGDLARLKHTMIPALEYSYIQDSDQGGLPFFDYDDRVLGQHQIGWLLSSSLTGRFDTPVAPIYRELFNFRLSQGYQLSGERRDLLNPADEHRRFTDIRLETVIRPSKAFSIQSDTRFSPYRSDVSTAAVSANLQDDVGNAAGISYRQIAGSVDYLEGRFALNIVNPFVLQYTGRYSFDSDAFLENYYVVEYRHQCWSLSVSYRERPDDKSFMVNFSLAGIGSFGKMK